MHTYDDAYAEELVKWTSMGYIVWQLFHRIPDGKGHKLFFDKFFILIVLLKELLYWQISAAGTIHFKHYGTPSEGSAFKPTDKEKISG